MMEVTIKRGTTTKSSTKIYTGAYRVKSTKSNNANTAAKQKNTNARKNEIGIAAKKVIVLGMMFHVV